MKVNAPMYVTDFPDAPPGHYFYVDLVDDKPWLYLVSENYPQNFVCQSTYLSDDEILVSTARYLLKMHKERQRKILIRQNGKTKVMGRPV